MNRTTLSLIAGVTALAAVTGFAALSAPDAAGTATARRRPPSCPWSAPACCARRPAPRTSRRRRTRRSPPSPRAPGATGKAELQAAGEESADGKTDDGDKGRQEGRRQGRQGEGRPDAEGAGQAGHRRGLRRRVARARRHRRGQVRARLDRPADHGGRRGHRPRPARAPTAPLPTRSSGSRAPAPPRSARTTSHLTNPDDSAAVVDIELYGKDGALKSDGGGGHPVPPHSSEPVLLSTLTDEPQTNLTVHVNVRSGRVGAAVQAVDDKLGGDWLAASTDPAGSLVLPGIPKDATSVRLVAFAPGDADADLKVRLASPNGPITPAGNETLHVKAGMTAAVDLGDVTRGEAGSLVLTPTGPVRAGRRGPAGRPRQGRQAGDGVHPGDRPGRHARDGRRQPRQGLHALPDRPRPHREGQGHGLRGQRAAARPRRRRTRSRRGTTQNVELPVPERPQGHVRPDGRAAVRRPGLRGAHARRRRRTAYPVSRCRRCRTTGERWRYRRRSRTCRCCRSRLRGRRDALRAASRGQSSPYRGSTVSGVSPSSSATCSTTTSCTSAARSSRPLVRISTGRR